MTLEQLIEELTRIRNERQAFPHADVKAMDDNGTATTIARVEVLGGEVILS